VRDARHVHNGPHEPAHRASKNKRRWCRGKPSIEHKLIVALDRTWIFPRLVRHCSACGKEFGWHSTGMGLWRKAPDWASPEDLRALERAAQEPRPKFGPR